MDVLKRGDGRACPDNEDNSERTAAMKRRLNLASLALCTALVLFGVWIAAAGNVFGDWSPTIKGAAFVLGFGSAIAAAVSSRSMRRQPDEHEIQELVDLAARRKPADKD